MTPLLDTLPADRVRPAQGSAGHFDGWTLTQTVKTATSRAWTLTEADNPHTALYLYRDWDPAALQGRGMWRRRTGSAGVDWKALTGRQRDREGEYLPDTDETRGQEVVLIEAAFSSRFGGTA